MSSWESGSDLREIQRCDEQEYKGYTHQKDGASEPENKFETARMQQPPAEMIQGIKSINWLWPANLSTFTLGNTPGIGRRVGSSCCPGGWISIFTGQFQPSLFSLALATRRYRWRCDRNQGLACGQREQVVCCYVRLRWETPG